MKYVTIPETTLETLIEGLEDSLNVCFNENGTGKLDYAYIAGYLYSTVNITLSNLKELQPEAN